MARQPCGWLASFSWARTLYTRVPFSPQPMRRFPLVLLLAALPLAALALDYTDRSARYTDAPFPKPEATAISVLTNLGAVSGNADGTFAPRRTLNRAEFLKIALLSAPIAVGQSAAACFPDVHVSDWFSRYVCDAKNRGVIQGYPDGSFHPDRAVNYAEALKILSKLFDYALTAQAGDQWFDPFVRAAQGRGTLLPISVGLDSPLTRGQMARLTAGFVAESQGELALYRAREQGKTFPSSASSSEALSSSVSSAASSVSAASSASSTSSVSSSSSLPSSSPSSSSASSLSDFPARSRFLMVGAWSPPLASATFVSSLEPAMLRFATVKLKKEITSISRMELIGSDGHTIGLLTLDPADSDNLTWKGTFQSGALLLPQNAERTVGIRVLLKDRDSGGKSEELVQVDTFTIEVVGQWSQNSYNSASQNFSFPQHQTTQALITAVRSLLPSQGVLPVGTQQLIASFSFSGAAVPIVSPRIESIDFSVNKSSTIAVSSWKLMRADGTDKVPCSVSQSVVSCLTLPVETGTIGSQPLVLNLYGDVAVDQGATYPYLEVDLGQPGALGVNGAIRWTDGSGHYNWVPLSNPIATGTRWQG